MYRFLAFFLSLITLSVSCSQPTGKTPQPHEIIEGKISYVIDGNTFYFTSDYGKVKARIYNIDTPAIKDKNGFEAYEFLRELAHQKSAYIEYIDQDSEGRWLVDANLDTGQNLRSKILDRFPPPKPIRKLAPKPGTKH